MKTIKLKYLCIFVTGFILIMSISILAYANKPQTGLPAPDIAPAKFAAEMPPGTWGGENGIHRYVEYGSYKHRPLLWRVLSVTEDDSDNPGNKTALLLCENVILKEDGAVETIAFDATPSNDWNSSDIKRFLYTDFVREINGALQFDIVQSHYKYGGSYPGHDTDSSGSVFLLSTDDLNNPAYFDDDTDRAASSTWWLRSPGEQSVMAASVHRWGNVQPKGNATTTNLGVRPAIKLNLSADVLKQYPVFYGTGVKVTDEMSKPVCGAKLELGGKTVFTNTEGYAHITAVSPEDSNLTVTKAGYSVHIEKINFKKAISVTLKKDKTVLPDRIWFGEYNGEPIKWRVLDLDTTHSQALLLADHSVFKSQYSTLGDKWSTSVARFVLNDRISGFVSAKNFTEEEYAALKDTELRDTYKEDGTTETTTDKVFLLNMHDLRLYMDYDDNYYNRPQLINAGNWWLRQSVGISPIIPYVNNDGILYADEATVTLDLRPALWVDLSKLYVIDINGNPSLKPLKPVTVTVTAGEKFSSYTVVTLCPEMGLPTYDACGNPLLLSKPAVGAAGATFELPAGKYNINAVSTIDRGFWRNKNGKLTIMQNAQTQEARIALNPYRFLHILIVCITVGGFVLTIVSAILFFTRMPRCCRKYKRLFSKQFYR